MLHENLSQASNSSDACWVMDPALDTSNRARTERAALVPTWLKLTLSHRPVSSVQNKPSSVRALCLSSLHVGSPRGKAMLGRWPCLRCQSPRPGAFSQGYVIIMVYVYTHILCCEYWLSRQGIEAGGSL